MIGFGHLSLACALLQFLGVNCAHRGLSKERFITYEPATTVIDHAAIDLDQQTLESQLVLQTNQGMSDALKVYVQGAFSGSYAELMLDSPLPVDVAKGTSVVGIASNGDQVRGNIAASFKAGDTILQISYAASQQQATWTNCHVGGNPDPNTDGCFAPQGTIEIGVIGTWTYTYDPLRSNFNQRTLQQFSISAKEKMYECPNCPYETYNKFYEYYGVFDYGNQWILAAFNGGSTNFAKGNANFAVYGPEGTTEAIRKGTVYMNTWMYVIHQMEAAIDDCESEGPTSHDAVHNWDIAVAYYTGSIPKTSGDGGHLLYTQAQKRCANFGTCVAAGPKAGMAKVNMEVFELFTEGKQSLSTGNCTDVRGYVERITELMTVPLVQGALRYAYMIDKQNDTREKPEAEGASITASVLPLLNACNAPDADILYSNMRVGNGAFNFEVVKATFERNYDCLGITCEDVGGLVDPVTGGYLMGAEPCASVATIDVLTEPSSPDLGNTTTGAAGYEEAFLSFVPYTSFNDTASVDLDQEALEMLLNLSTAEGRINALKIYTGGAFSGSYAEVNLIKPIQIDLDKGMAIVGQTADGHEVQGVIIESAPAGATYIKVLYKVSSMQQNWTGCYVGGNPDPVTDGCFAPTGTLRIGRAGSAPYSFDPLASNFNLHNIQKFSRQAEDRFFLCQGCPYRTYFRFYQYYGKFDYADEWILAAITGGSTSFANGNADFSDYGFNGTNEAIQKGAVLISTWMYMIGEMERAIDDCNYNCTAGICLDIENRASSWDEAVAYYTGSVPLSTGEDGYLLYAQAQELCEKFGTCAEDGAGAGYASVNLEVFAQFNDGQQNWLNGNCSALTDNVDRITDLMTVPLVQGTLMYAYLIDKENDSGEASEGSGATYAASVLPLLHDCNEADAEILYANMRFRNERPVNFDVVKAAFERNYECLGITCEDVGGLVDSTTGDYLTGAEPCSMDLIDAEDLIDPATSTSRSPAIKEVCDPSSALFVQSICQVLCEPGRCWYDATVACAATNLDCSIYEACRGIGQSRDSISSLAPTLAGSKSPASTPTEPDNISDTTTSATSGERTTVPLSLFSSAAGTTPGQWMSNSALLVVAVALIR